jgi:hypothetical protein
MATKEADPTPTSGGKRAAKSAAGNEAKSTRDWSDGDLSVVVVFALLALGLAATAVFSSQQVGAWSVLASSVLFAGASLLAGGAFGFLFGIPRALAGNAQPSSTARGYAGNTNLEQISDWLTKIIVGVTLTQLGTIHTGAQRLFNSMAPLLAGKGTLHAPYAGGIVIYFAILGFIFGWLLTRLKLGAQLAKADQDSEVGGYVTAAIKAEQTGDTATASDLVDRALSAATAGGSPTMATYEQLRSTLAPGRARTAELESYVQAMVAQGGVEKAEARQLTESDDSGQRAMGLGHIRESPDPADLSVLLTVVSQPRSAFEQYMALEALEKLVHSLNGDQRMLARSAIQQQELPPGKLRPNTDRRRLADRILGSIGTTGLTP